MGAKEDFEAQFLLDLPDGIKDMLEVPIPALSATTLPTDVDTAIVAQGILAHNLNTIFKAFEGLTLAAIPMYIGQLNTINQGMLAAALEFVGARGEIVLLAPVQDGVYYGYFSRWKAELVRGGIDAIAGSVGPDKFEFEEVEDKLFSADWILPVGRHTARIWGSYGGEVLTDIEEVSFEVKSFEDVPTIPDNGEVLSEPLNAIKFLSGADSADLEMSVSVDENPPVVMHYIEVDGWVFEDAIIANGDHVVTFYHKQNGVKTIHFSITG